MTQGTTYQGLPVKGYQQQSQQAVDLANEGKELEERYLRWLDRLSEMSGPETINTDKRFVALARTNLQQAAMWAIRSIFQPGRIALPEDRDSQRGDQ